MLSRYRSLLFLLVCLCFAVPLHAQQPATDSVPTLQLENTTAGPVTVYAVVQGQRIRLGAQLNSNERRLLQVQDRYVNPTGTVVFFIKPLTGEGYFTDPIQLSGAVTINLRLLDYGPGWLIGIRKKQ